MNVEDFSTDNYSKHNKRLAKYVTEIQNIFKKLNLEGCKIALDLTDIKDNFDKALDFSKHPQTTARIKKLMAQYQKDISIVIANGIEAEYKKSNDNQNSLSENLIERCNTLLPDDAPRLSATGSMIITSSVNKARDAFLSRTQKGITLKSKLALQSQEYIKELQSAISVAIGAGTDARTLSKQVCRLFDDFKKLERDYKQKFGEALPAKSIQYQAMRLARTEINMAYRDAEQERWKDMPYILGYEIKLSNNHNCKGVPKGKFFDFCDELQGKYPKDFKWLGWHPNCYHKDTQILTNKGWKYFFEVEDTDLIYSLNPDTRQAEWVRFVARQKYWYEGDLVRFYNRSLECQVTPEHSMVYFSKSNKEVIKRCEAHQYTQGKGGFIRSCSYDSKDIESITIENLTLKFDAFCEFMAYYLSDGNLMHSGICISQQQNQDAYCDIVSCINNLGFEPIYKNGKIIFYNSALARYLSKFGTSSSKYIPIEIINSSPRQICIFLDAYVRCDGHCRENKSFVGNRGNVFSSKKMERTFFTTSHRLAGNICDLLLKIGNRPSFSIRKPSHTTKTDGTVIKSKLDCYIIRECYSTTSTQFSKELVPYSDFVYDLTLEKNHIFYVALNGKCFWGSNCRCKAIPILMSDKDFIKWNNDEKVEIKQVTEMPKKFDKWLKKNSDRIQRANQKGTLPYFLRDNESILYSSRTSDKLFVDNHFFHDTLNTSLSGIREKLSPTPIENTKVIEEFFGNIISEDRKLNASFGGFAFTSSEFTFMSSGIKNKIITINFADSKNGFNAGKCLVSAVENIKKGQKLSFNEEYAIECLWHELLHNMSKNSTQLPIITSPEGFTRAMVETANQLVARHTYDSFMKKFNVSPLHKNNILENGYGYSSTVTNLRKLLKKANIDENKFTQRAMKLLMKDYAHFDEKLFTELSKMYTKSHKQALKYVYLRLEVKEFLDILEILP